jgi:hypothetical protein
MSRDTVSGLLRVVPAVWSDTNTWSRGRITREPQDAANEMVRQMSAGVKLHQRQMTLHNEGGTSSLGISQPSAVAEQMEFSAKLMVNGDHGAIDVTDQTIAKDDVRDFPVATSPDIRQRVKRRDARGLTSRLVAQRLVRELRQFGTVLSNRRHHDSGQA